MRFETRFDRWLVVVLAFGFLCSCVLIPLLHFTGTGPLAAPLWLVFLPWVAWLAVLAATLPQYYMVLPEGLFLRQGWRRIPIPYDSLIELSSTSDARSAGVFSTQRIDVVTRENRRYIIAVAREEEFLAEVARRCPQLQRPRWA